MSLLQNCYIAFVNLDHRKDRLDRMLVTLKNAGLEADRVRGILPHETKFHPNRIEKMLSRPQKGAIGCFESQLSIMRKADNLDKHAFVMEDDLIICSDFQKRIDYIDQWTQKNYDWDIIWLGATFHINPPYWHKDNLGRDAELTDDPRMIRTYGSFCTYAYIVNKRSIMVVEEMLSKIMSQSIGIDWSMIQISPKLKTFAFVPGCMTQYDNQSDIGKGITEFSRFAKLNGTIENSLYWYQDKMEDFDPTKFNWAEAFNGQDRV